MRQIFARGLAIAASLALLSPAFAQSTYDPNTTRFNSILSTLNWPAARSAGFSRSLQETAPAAPQETPAEQASPSDRVVPLPEQGPSSVSSDCGPGEKSYFDSDAQCNSCNPNWVLGVYGLAFRRDYEDDVGLSAVPSNLSAYLNSTSAKMGTMGGFETVLSRRGCDGRGFEIRYWGLYPEEQSAYLNGAYTNLTGLSQVEFGGFPVSQIYNGGTSHWVYRDNEFHNLELNLLHCIGSSNCGNRNWEWLAGFRYFSFDEEFNYATFTQNPNYPPSLYYELCTHNDLYGFQVGTKTERCWCNGLGFQFATKFGVYGNHIEACQAIHDDGGANAEISSGPYAGNDYYFESSKDDFSTIGELSLGLTYQLKCNWRAVGGYRALGITGVALAPDQIPNNFTDSQDIARIKSNGSLILHGAYFGLEHCF